VNFGESLERVEVTTTINHAWHLREGQLSRVSRVILVLVDDGCCWMIEARHLRDFIGEMRSKSASITVRQLTSLNPAAWHKEVPRLCLPVPPKTQKAIKGQPGNRVLVKRLADGTTKRYEYPRWRL